MSSDTQQDGRALQEAWRWVTVLSAPFVSTKQVEDFFVWRRLPGNDAAYLTAEKMHQLSGAAKSSTVVQQTLAAIDAKAARRRGSGLSPALGWAGACAFAMIVLGLVALGGSLFSGFDDYQTNVGERRVVRLADGSSVSLDTDSRIAVHYKAGSRNVALLRGQALFDVAHSAARPFSVTAAMTTVRDLGTRFNVRRDADAVSVTLIAGSAEVASRAGPLQSWTLVPGQQVRTGPSASTPHWVDPAAATSWTSGHLMFDGLPLAAAVQEVNRYGGRTVALSGSNLAHLPISGTFDAGDSQGFVAGVSKLYNLKAEARLDGAIVLRSAGAVGPT